MRRQGYTSKQQRLGGSSETRKASHGADPTGRLGGDTPGSVGRYPKVGEGR